jgi:Zn-dependent protease
MLPSLKIGRLFGIPVYLHSTLLLLPALVFFTTSDQGWPTSLLVLATTAALFGCVLLHEFGHALMARRFGIVTRDVTLYPIGGIARLERMTERPFEEILIALAGPAVNVVIVTLLTPVVIGFLLLGVGLPSQETFITFADSPVVWLAMFCSLLWLMNIMLVVFNLIPAFPMDGGRVFRAILAHFFGLLRGTEIAVRVGIVIAVLLAIIMTGVSIRKNSFNPMPLVIAGFIGLVGPMELRALRLREQQKHEEALWRQQQQAASSEPLPYTPLPYTPLPYPDEEADLAPPPVRQPEGFSGFTWDREFGVWVKWQNGRRVAVFGNGPE